MPNLISKISDKMDTLTYSQKNVASYFLYHVDKVAFGTVHDLAKQIHVSTTTIVRFSQEMGYTGFAELQRDAQLAILDMNPSSVLSESEKFNIDETNVLEQTFQMDIANLEKTLKSIDENAMAKAVDLLNNGKHIYVAGMRVCRTLSTYAVIHWGQARPNVRLVHNDSLAFPEEIADIKENDVLVAFWVSRYNKLMQSIIRYCKRRKAKVILISDVGSIAYNESWDVNIQCYVQTSSYMHSLAAPIAVIDYFTRAIEGHYGAKAAERLSQMDELLGNGFFLT